MQSALADLIPVGLMSHYNIPVERFYGRQMDVVTRPDRTHVHSDRRCGARPNARPRDARRARFDADIASRMCGCCRVETVTADNTLSDVLVDLVSLCELLAEEAEETENREEPDYVPDFLRPNHNWDHWRTLQTELSQTAHGLQAHSWLLDWARSTLERAVAYVERRCREQQSIINTATLHQATVELQQVGATTQSARIWQAWRHRQDSTDNTSPDYAAYDLSARLQLPDGDTAHADAQTRDVSVRLPPLGRDPDAFTAVEPLSLWETTAIVAYTASADWIRGIVTLAAPPLIAQELLNPARALDIFHHPSGAGRKSQPSPAR
ncbi:hypothetical protein ACIRG4_34095 [Streptomyces sp. NPDC102395]|uniref:hypothetical protein n=1 Tax=Streptomyces sp. NPDC102395 TaxID=3366168 RepID=UPI003807B3CF